MNQAAFALLLCALLATAACTDTSRPIPPNRTDLGSCIGAPGGGAP